MPDLLCPRLRARSADQVVRYSHSDLPLPVCLCALAAVAAEKGAKTP